MGLYSRRKGIPYALQLPLGGLFLFCLDLCSHLVKPLLVLLPDLIWLKPNSGGETVQSFYVQVDPMTAPNLANVLSGQA